VVPYVQELHKLSFMKDKMEQRINHFFENPGNSQPFGIHDKGIPVKRGLLEGIENFTSMWGKILREFGFSTSDNKQNPQEFSN
jgi:hypothetical protein